MKTKILFAFIILNILNLCQLQAQGCSDAGICTAGGMSQSEDELKKGSIALNTQLGIGEQNVQIITPQLETMVRITKHSFIQLKVPYVFVNGNLGKGSALGDIIAVAGYSIINKEKYKLALNAGMRIGVNSADFESSRFAPAISSIPLPMPYQTSLGTHDFLIGIDFKTHKNWLFALGLQLPFGQWNQNGFDTSLVDVPEAKKYFSSEELRRKPDMVLRIDKSYKLKEKFTMNGGFLGIYHLGLDRALNAMGDYEAIAGSKGLTLNVNMGATYKMSKHFSLIGRFATPLIVRKVRPDGLTRKFVAGLELRISF